MRQGQQNRRGRGRNRKSGGHNNPLTRSYESNGPDVKIRGTPAHIAEKYITLARDAQSSGDPVLAENYLQHAEHYNRIIMTFREQQLQQGGDVNGGMVRNRPYSPGEPFDDEFDDDGDDDDMQPPMGSSRFDSPQRNDQPRHDDRPQRNDDRPHRNDRPQQSRHDGNRPQREPYQQQNRQFDRQDRGDRHDRGDRQDRNDRGDRGDRNDRNDRQDRPERQDRQDHRPERIARSEPVDRFESTEQVERNERPERIDRPERVERAERPERIERAERPERVERERPPRAPDVGASDQPPVAREPAPRRRDRFVDQADQPEFLRRPVRRPRREAQETAGGAESPAPIDPNPVDKTTA